ncbi:MAG: class I adenylate-forming enzyme family protein [Gammaproteobacteria bacterium]
MSKTDNQNSRIRVTTLGDLLLSAADEHADSPAIVFPEFRLTYAELRDKAMQRARGLLALGVQQGEHVGILLPTCYQFPEIFFAVSLCGAVPVPINARYQSHELTYVVQNGDLVTVITTDEIAEQVNFVERLSRGLPGISGITDARHANLTEAPMLRNLVLLGSSSAPGFLSETEFDEAATTVSDDDVHGRRMQVRVRDPGLMLYTSGTTANPKGAVISHEAMVRNSIALGRQRYKLTKDDRFWSPLPMFHIAAILPIVSSFDVGAAYLTMSYFDAGVALDMLEREEASVTYPCFITIMSDLIHHPNFEKTDLSKVRLMNSNFAVQPPGIAEAMQKAMPNTIQVGTFGMTETAGTVCTSELHDPLETRVSRLGTPLPGMEVRIVSLETGKEMPVDERGEILVRGYSLFDYYYKDPEKTASAKDSDGWYHTGDVGAFNADGQIMFYGRTKDMLKVGGENVAAAEIESFLARHEAVKMAQVVGVSDDRLGEVAAAFVELADGKTVTAEELIAFCKGEIAGFKVPRYVRFVTEWPMSTSKIQKYKLRDELEKELG